MGQDWWKLLSHLQSQKDISEKHFFEEDQEIEKRIRIIKKIIKDNKELPEKYSEYKEFIRKKWEQFIRTAIKELKKDVENANFKNSEYQQDIEDLEKIEVDLELENFGLKQYDNTYTIDLIDIKKRIKEKLSNDKRNLRFSVLTLIISSISSAALGVFLTWLVMG